MTQRSENAAPFCNCSLGVLYSNLERFTVYCDQHIRILPNLSRRIMVGLQYFKTGHDSFLNPYVGMIQKYVCTSFATGP